MPTSCCRRATTLERNDISAGWWDNVVYAMKQAIPPVGESRVDFRDRSQSSRNVSGHGAAFTEGRDEMGWLRFLYDSCRTVSQQQIELPDSTSSGRTAASRCRQPATAVRAV